MRFYAFFLRLYRLAVAASLGSCAVLAQAHTSLQEQAHAKIEQAMDRALSAPQRATLERQITLTSPRGAALRPCPTAWQWEPIHLEHWRRIHIGVRCEGAEGSLVAVIHARAPLWTTTRALPKGHRLQSPDLQRQTLEVTRAQDMPDASTLLHMQLRKPLRAGVAVQMQHVERVPYARKGQSVEIRASVEGITVSTTGIATRTAYQGESLRVRNVRSQQWVSGRLIAPGVLEANEEASGGVKVQMQSAD